MKVSIDWIKDFTTVPDSKAQDIASNFTLRTAEVEGVETKFSHLANITVVEVLEKNKHPDAEKLSLVTFTDGKTKRQVVCGAPNVKVGMKTAYAPLGTCFPDGLVLEPKKIRGILSEGMLCSEEELGTSTESSGIIELKADAILGQKIADHLKIKTDVILDIDNKSLTHRPDLWGHLGMAREFASIYGHPLKNIYSTDSWRAKMTSHLNSKKSPITPILEGTSAARIYLGLSIDQVTVGNSPEWMKRRLEAVGLRSINNIVDISNYVMLELGHPLHIFDRDKIAQNKIVIKKLGKESSFLTLDEMERPLIASDTVICDANGPLVIAGLMGGKSSGVSDTTKNIFIEVANWQAALVRQTSTRLGLRTDSSQRFEKTLDDQFCEIVMLRTLELVLELCPKAQVQGRIETASAVTFPKPLLIETSLKNINRLLGFSLEEKKLISIFESLDFKVKKNGDTLQVTVPSFRATKDIEIEEDLVEEVGRIIGYGNIAPVSPLLAVKPVNLSPAQKVQRKLRDFLVYQARATEVFTYPMVGEKLVQKAKCTLPTLKLLNALSVDHNLMRNSLQPSLLEMCANNSKNFSKFKTFELGKIYLPNEKNFSQEKSLLALAYFDKDENPFPSLLNTCESIFELLGLSFQIMERDSKFKNILIDETWQGLHPFEYLNFRVQGKLNAAVFSLHPMLARDFKIKGNLCFALIDLDEVEASGIKDKVKYQPIAKFPSSSFDFTLAVDPAVKLEDIVQVMKKTKLAGLVSSKVVDVYQAPQSLVKSVTMRALFQQAERTLETKELQDLREQLLLSLSKAGYHLKKE
jgi:phenylalanyl-tRNA synthetase beta chain